MCNLTLHTSDFISETINACTCTQISTKTCLFMYDFEVGTEAFCGVVCELLQDLLKIQLGVDDVDLQNIVAAFPDVSLRLLLTFVYLIA